MSAWHRDMLEALPATPGIVQTFDRIRECAHLLGFEHCAYGLRLPMSFTRPLILTLSTYDDRWKRRYHEAGYVDIDPTVKHGVRSCRPLVWSDALFAPAKQLWDEAHAFGLRVGWAQSCFDGRGAVGMLTLARGQGALTSNELAIKDPQLRWLTNVAHVALTSVLNDKAGAGLGLRVAPLTPREVDVLKWTADGKTSDEIALLLGISGHTVSFHVKNALLKLRAGNKAAAVARAAILGLLG